MTTSKTERRVPIHMTVRGQCHERWYNHLEKELLDCEADTTVGRRVLGYLAVMDAVISLTDEDGVLDALIEATKEQINVWMFG